MENRQPIVSKSLIAVLAAGFSLAQAQVPKATLEKQLESQYTLTTPTADNTDLVTVGSVLILQKKGFTAGSVSNKVPTQNTYKDKDERIKSSGASIQKGVGRFASLGSMIPVVGGVASGASSAANVAGTSREFVNGEKLYVTKITVDRSKDGIAFELISDAIANSGRYKGTLTFQFPKGSVGSADLAQVEPVIEQVFKIAPPDQPAGQSAAAPQVPPTPTVQTQTEAPPPPIAPPPPPPPPDPVVETKSIEVGQTKEQVEAILGKPDKILTVGSKEIYQYKDIKVTFVKGKMTDAQ